MIVNRSKFNHKCESIRANHLDTTSGVLKAEMNEFDRNQLDNDFKGNDKYKIVCICDYKYYCYDVR